ncbi:MAG: adenylate/guanylate cyclase domain-containing protein [Spirochaetota bacterium]
MAAIEEGFARNLKQLSVFRFVTSITSFTMASIVVGFSLDDKNPSWQAAIPFSVLYFFISVIFYYITSKLKYLHVLAEWSIQIIDIPVFYFFIISMQKYYPMSDLDLGYFLAMSLLVIFISPTGVTYYPKIVATLECALLSPFVLHQSGRHPFPEWVPSYITIYLFAGMIGVFLVERTYRIAYRFSQVIEEKEKMGRYFSPGVMEYISKDRQAIESRSHNVTVLVSDIRGFTSLSEKLQAEEVVDLLNEYFAAMVKVIFRYNGTLDKFMGDGILAYFGAPVEREDHAELAIACAKEMQHVLQELNQKRNQRGELALQIGIGLHSGDVILGNVGSESRQEFTIIGNTVNIASRIESLTKEYQTELLISKDTLESSKSQSNWQSTGKLKIRGREEPLELFYKS